MFNEDKNDKAGCGNMIGSIASPQASVASPGNAGGVQGGEPDGPFGQYKQSGNTLPIQTRDKLTANPNSGGRFQTPMDGTTSIGATGQASGTGAAGKGKISSPMGSPFGEL